MCVQSTRSSHRLMWSSANGSHMRSQATPGATYSAVPGAGSLSQQKQSGAFPCGLAIRGVVGFRLH